MIHTTATTIFSADQLPVWNEHIILILVKGLIIHQLTVFEMEEISGGALTDTLTDIMTWAAKEVGATLWAPLWGRFLVQVTLDVGAA